MRILICAAMLAAGGCAVDTELGLAAEIGASSVDVRADAAGDVVSVVMDVTYRVGEHAQESHDFVPQGIDVFVGDAFIVALVPNRPPTFVSTLSPGQSITATFTAASAPGGATDPRRLCGAEARLHFRWADGATGELGMTETSTANVTCD